MPKSEVCLSLTYALAISPSLQEQVAGSTENAQSDPGASDMQAFLRSHTPYTILPPPLTQDRHSELNDWLSRTAPSSPLRRHQKLFGCLQVQQCSKTITKSFVSSARQRSWVRLFLTHTRTLAHPWRVCACRTPRAESTHTNTRTMPTRCLNVHTHTSSSKASTRTRMQDITMYNYFFKLITTNKLCEKKIWHVLPGQY